MEPTGADGNYSGVVGNPYLNRFVLYRIVFVSRPCSQLPGIVESPGPDSALIVQGQRFYPSGADLGEVNASWHDYLGGLILVCGIVEIASGTCSGINTDTQLSCSVESPGPGVTVVIQGQGVVESGGDFRKTYIGW